MAAAKQKEQVINFIQKGDTLGLISLCSPPEEERFLAGRSYLQRQGFRTIEVLDPVRAREDMLHRFSPYSPKELAQALLELYENPEVKLILTNRGGSGGLGVLPELNLKQLAAHNKLFVGFSDAVNFFVPLFQQAGLNCVHGANLSSSFADAESCAEAKCSADALLDLICGKRPADWPLEQLCGPQESVTGPVFGGNLSVFLSLMGTPFEPDFAGKIVLFEDIGERPFRVRRKLQQLRLAKKVDSAKAVVFGELSSGPDYPFPDILREFIPEQLGHLGIPVFFSAPVGHGRTNLPFLLGSRATLAGSALRFDAPSDHQDWQAG